jgi:hypothetical protein
MVFCGQLPLLGTLAAVAYIFIAIDGAPTFEPLSDGNAVVIQRGAPPHRPVDRRSTGPGLHERVPQPGRYRPVTKYRRYERYVDLEPSADPPAWTWPDAQPGVLLSDNAGDWRKIGGTPLFLQSDESPPGDGWQFAFQFEAGWAGFELGDGAICYGFTDRAGRGAMLWQCH